MAECIQTRLTMRKTLPSCSFLLFVCDVSHAKAWLGRDEVSSCLSNFWGEHNKGKRDLN